MGQYMVFSIFAIFSLHKNLSVHILETMKKIIIIPASIITLLTVGYLYVVLLLPLELPKMHSSTVFIDIK